MLCEAKETMYTSLRRWDRGKERRFFRGSVATVKGRGSCKVADNKAGENGRGCAAVKGQASLRLGATAASGSGEGGGSVPCRVGHTGAAVAVLWRLGRVHWCDA